MLRGVRPFDYRQWGPEVSWGLLFPDLSRARILQNGMLLFHPLSSLTPEVKHSFSLPESYPNDILPWKVDFFNWKEA